jgi:hypothetical protein
MPGVKLKRVAENIWLRTGGLAGLNHRVERATIHSRSGQSRQKSIAHVSFFK